MQKYNLSDWRKVAAQVIDDNESEAAFMEQAFGHIQNKARPFMKGDYRLGFEIVYKNDEFTKAIGIFAFRIGRKLYYAPCFFVNGDIKGTDLLYSHDIKLFRPLTSDWVNYEISKYEREQGAGLAKAETNKITNNLNLKDIARPPLHKKTASTNLDDTSSELPVRFDKKAAEKIWEEMTSSVFEHFTKEAAEEQKSVLREFFIENPHTFEKFAKALEDDFDFAEAVVTLLDEDEFCPDEMFQHKKEASSDNEPGYTLALHMGGFNPMAKVASEEQISKGYSFEDLRKEANISLTFEAMTGELSSVNNAGEYDIVTTDSNLKNSFCARVQECIKDDISIEWDCEDTGSQNNFLIVDLQDNSSKVVYNSLPMGVYKRSVSGMDGILVDEAQEGKLYYIFDNTKKVVCNTTPFYVKEKKTSDGITTYESEFITLRHNPDYNGPCEDNIIGSNHKFIEVSVRDDSYAAPKKLDWCPGTARHIDNFIMNGGFKSASVKSASDGYLVSVHGRHLNGLSKVAATAVIMAECSVREDTADAIIKEATDKTSVSFYFDKSGSQVRMDSIPDFHTSFDSDFNVQYEEPMTHVIEGTTVPGHFPQSRIGDKVTHTSSTIIETATPQELAEYAETIGNKNIFEHGIIGSLAKTYDSIALVDKYLVDMQNGLDKIGRMIFLFYWKPEDFIEAYGSDDQSDLENMLISNFKSFGDLVLELLQKSDDKDSRSSNSTEA